MGVRALNNRRTVSGRRPGLRLLGLAVLALVVVALVGGLVANRLITNAPEPSSSTAAGSSPAGRWWSGAASDEAADGRFGEWRGSPVAIGGTWDNGNKEQIEMRTICPGGPWANWDQRLDIAIGAIDVDAGESWSAAAGGAYVERWRAHLQRLAECWGARDPALVYIRFAHEMNLPQKWRVHAGEEADFVKAITLYSDLRYEIIPSAKIVLCPNDGTSPELMGLDVRRLWPGKDAQGRPVADLYAVDSYNQAPHVNDPASFTKKINASYDNGAPLGIEKHRQFAEANGVPFAVPEWSNSGDPQATFGGGESPLYIREFNSWVRAHAGDPSDPKPGQVLYEIHFNLWEQFRFWPETQQPQTADVYRTLPWGR